MKRLIYKYILRAKYMVNGKFFWSRKSARAYGEANAPAIVFTVDWKKVSHFHSYNLNYSHPDFSNFNRYQ